MKTKIIINSLFALILASFGTVMAQSASTGPNKVYIEQIGNSNTITIEQVGGTNNIGGTGNVTPSSTNYATINGSTNSVSITQTGDSNLSQYDIYGNNNTYSSVLTGNLNSSKLNIGTISSATNLRNTVTETVTGNSNTIVQTILGNDINSTIAITGNTNQITKELKSSSGISNVSMTGNNNKLNSQQIDIAGADGHELQLAVLGDYNSYVIQQQGVNDTTVDVKTTGSHNTVTVRTSSSSIINPATAVAR
jgi:hypothetical protein